MTCLCGCGRPIFARGVSAPCYQKMHRGTMPDLRWPAYSVRTEYQRPRYHQWTIRESRAAVEAARTGKPAVAELAARLGITTEAVYMRVRRATATSQESA